MTTSGHWELTHWHLVSEETPGQLEEASAPQIAELITAPDEYITTGIHLYITHPVNKDAVYPFFTATGDTPGVDTQIPDAGDTTFTIGQFREASFGSTSWLKFQTWEIDDGFDPDDFPPDDPTWVVDDIPVDGIAVFARVTVSSVGPSKIKYVTIK